MSFKTFPGPALYNDLNKKSTDLLNKDFPTFNKLEFKTSAKDGLVVEANVTEKDGSSVGTFTPKFNFPAWGTLSLGVDTKRNVKVEASSSTLVPGTKFTLSGVTESETVTSELEYKHKNLAATASLNLFSSKGTTASVSTVVGHEGYSLGLQTDYNFSTNTINNLNGAFSYFSLDPKIPTVTLFGKFKRGVAGFNVHHKLTDRVSAAAEGEYNYVNNAENPKLTVGVSYEADALTTLKGKIDTNGHVAASVSTRVNSLRLTVGTVLNSNNFSAPSKANFGVHINVE